jgi:hypothetical protein
MKGSERVEQSSPTESTRQTVSRTPAAPGASPRTAGPSPAQALALQRAAGNRAAARMLSRWIKHPDKEKKGIVVPDVSAAAYDHFNPPKNE